MMELQFFLLSPQPFISSCTEKKEDEKKTTLSQPEKFLMHSFSNVDKIVEFHSIVLYLRAFSFQQALDCYF
jgi:hypothetical protein